MSTDAHNTCPLKRARLSSEQNDSSPHASLSSTLALSNLQHHPKFWFDDGNIILIAQHIGFRVYRGLLAAQSVVFANTFAASSSRPDESLEGCPVVHLSDSHHDLAHLLRALMPMSPILYDPTNPELARSFNELSAIVRLAHKYDIQSIQDQALRVLQEHRFTSDLNVYSCPRKQQHSFEGPHAIGAVNLARLTGTPLMLPTALFWCCHLGGKLLDGWTHEDGTVEYLCEADLKLCIDARSALGREQHLVCSRVFKAVLADGCTRPALCMQMLTALAHVNMDDLPDVHALLDFSHAIRRAGDMNSLCETCTQMMIARVSSERKRVWNALPQLLGIVVEGWPKPVD